MENGMTMEDLMELGNNDVLKHIDQITTDYSKSM